MFSIKKCKVPDHTMLARYTADGSYTDCYTTEIPGRISFPEFVFAFYTTFLFKLERLILRWTVSRPSTDIEARRLADGTIEKFAAWTVESRNDNELLMCDLLGRTRSWLMIKDTGARTRLYFGSAVVPIRKSRTGELSLGAGVQALLGFHKIYSVLLLYFAKLRINDRVLERSADERQKS